MSNLVAITKSPGLTVETVSPEALICAAIARDRRLQKSASTLFRQVINAEPVMYRLAAYIGDVVPSPSNPSRPVLWDIVDAVVLAWESSDPDVRTIASDRIQEFVFLRTILSFAQHIIYTELLFQSGGIWTGMDRDVVDVAEVGDSAIPMVSKVLSSSISARSARIYLATRILDSNDFFAYRGNFEQFGGATPSS